MPAGRGDFQGEAALRLAGYVAHVRGNTRAFLGTGLLLGVRGGRVGQLLRLCAKSREHLGQAAESAHLRAGDEGRLLRIFGGDDDPAVPGGNRGLHGGQDARNRANRPVEAQLPQEHAVPARV